MIDSEKIVERYRALGGGMSVLYVSQTGSTNADVAKMVAAGTPSGNFALIAGTQTAGRGRAGRAWASENPGNLYLSCGFRPMLPPTRLANFTLWMGFAVATLLREKFGISAVVKWPNDIFCEGKKLAGMLTEAHLTADGVRGIIFGLGLNVNLDPTNLPEDIRGIATSMRSLCSGKIFDVEHVCADVLLAIENAYEKFLAGTHTAELLARWNEFDWLAGKNVVAVYGDDEIVGLACGIDEQGRIRIRTSDGKICAFAAGDVVLKK